MMNLFKMYRKRKEKIDIEYVYSIYKAAEQVDKWQVSDVIMSKVRRRRPKTDIGLVKFIDMLEDFGVLLEVKSIMEEECEFLENYC